MEPKPAIRDELLAHAPGLRRFALSLCGTIDRAEDLVQDTFLQALTHLDSFQPGTNLAAWLVTILRRLERTGLRSILQRTGKNTGKFTKAGPFDCRLRAGLGWLNVSEQSAEKNSMSSTRRFLKYLWQPYSYSF